MLLTLLWICNDMHFKDICKKQCITSYEASINPSYNSYFWQVNVAVVCVCLFIGFKL